MTYTITSQNREPLRDAVAADLVASFERRGARCTDDVNGLQFVLNLTSAVAPRPYRRRSQSVFVISIVSIPVAPPNLRAFCYTTLVRSLSNLLMCVIPSSPGSSDTAGATVYFTTPEAGFYHLPYDPELIFSRVWPIATAHYSTANELVTDLPERFWRGSSVVDDIRRHGAALDRLGVLPLPFPLDQVLPAAEMHHLYKIFGMTGLSYGNLSAREIVTEFSNGSFWMTARGCDKAHLQGAGRDVLMVRRFDFDRGTAQIAMPPDGEPKARVSVDAVEHAMIYHSYPEVRAIVHVHAWMDGIAATHQNYPCGTLELAEEVARLLSTTPDPGRAVVGLKNHGITATGPSLEDIFDRFDGHLQTEVPMYA